MITTSTIETRCFMISRVEDNNNIIRVEKKLGADIQLEDVLEMDAIYLDLLEGNHRIKFLIVFSPDCSTDKKVRERITSLNRKIIKEGEALVVSTLANRIEANFYRKLYKLRHPIEIFNQEDEAIEWLKSVDSK